MDNNESDFEFDVGELKQISIVSRKPDLPVRKICNWKTPDNCKKKTKTPCMNQVCKKVACNSHSSIICFYCTQLSDLREKNILLSPRRSDKRKYCGFSSDKKRYASSAWFSDCINHSKNQCAIVECNKFMCGMHEFKLCHDCIIK